MDGVQAEIHPEDCGSRIVLKLLVQEIGSGIERVLPGVGPHLIEDDGNEIRLPRGDGRGRGWDSR